MAAFVERREVVAEGANSVNSELSDLGTAEEATPLEEVTGSRQDGELDRLMQRVGPFLFTCRCNGHVDMGRAHRNQAGDELVSIKV